ncbi:Golgi-associated kinase 1A isoform X1 [Lampetra planeri]
MRLKRRRRLLCLACVLTALVLVNIIASLPGGKPRAQRPRHRGGVALGAGAARRRGGGGHAEVLTERRPGRTHDGPRARAVRGGRQRFGDDSSDEWLAVDPPGALDAARRDEAKAAERSAAGDAVVGGRDAAASRERRAGRVDGANEAREEPNLVELIKGQGGWLGELGGKWLAGRFGFFHVESEPDPPLKGPGKHLAPRNAPRVPNEAAAETGSVPAPVPDPRRCAALGLAFDGSGDGGRANGSVPPDAPAPPPWFSREDLRILNLLSGGAVRRKETLPGHGAVLRLTLGPAGGSAASDGPLPPVEAGRDYCAEGACALAKRTGDSYEVLAFHLDRVLGLGRAPPAVSRRLDSWLLPYRFTNGTARPLIWWVPDILRLSDGANGLRPAGPRLLRFHPGPQGLVRGAGIHRQMQQTGAPAARARGGAAVEPQPPGVHRQRWSSLPRGGQPQLPNAARDHAVSSMGRASAGVSLLWPCAATLAAPGQSILGEPGGAGRGAPPGCSDRSPRAHPAALHPRARPRHRVQRMTSSSVARGGGGHGTRRSDEHGWLRTVRKKFKARGIRRTCKKMTIGEKARDVYGVNIEENGQVVSCSL